MAKIKLASFQFLQSLDKLLTELNWERLFFIALIVISPFLVFYNLELNPRPWHDEGAILSLPKTLAEDGIYATKNYGGYQTFGPIQSAGPTVVLPIVLMYRVFGVGILPARMIAGIYALMALLFFYLCGLKLFNRRAALLATFFLLGSPAAGFLLFGRHVLGDIPGLAFFLGGYWAWTQGLKNKQFGYFLLSGCMFGAAIVTKTQYLLMVSATLFILLVLDFIYYRQKLLKPVLVIEAIGLLWFFIWTAWQIYYFGIDTYRANANTFGSLASVTTGFDIRTTVQAFQFIFGSGSGFLYGFWGFFSLIYALQRCVRRDENAVSLILAFVLLLLWTGYFVFWTIPWHPYFIVPGTILALFVGGLADEIVAGILDGRKFLLTSFDKNRLTLFTGSIISIAALLAFVGYQFQTILRLDVLDRVGVSTPEFRKPPEFADPYKASQFINDNIPNEAIIDTWERELGILNNHIFHYPDQSMLVFTHAALYRGGPTNYSLGKTYFDEIKPDYVIIGWWARLTHIYDLSYIEKNSEYITRIGSHEWGYDIYKLTP